MNPPIEITARAGRLLGMPPQRFLRDYWQKRPLLIRQAFPGFISPIEPNDLAGAACEPQSLARLVIQHPRSGRWEVRSGPFEAATFAKLPKTRWTLLVQDCDKWFADVGALLAKFAFVPSWRLDDIMISYAVDGGSVGAHVDQYDVFLLQAQGRRRWQISDDPRAPRDFVPKVELKLLREFEPTHEWVLEPGDMLYLPPGIPHHGVALGECMTFSVGLRAPSTAELLLDLAEHAAERLGDEPRYADPDLRAVRDPAEVDGETIQRVARLLRQATEQGDSALGDWFAQFISRYRSAVAAAPRRRKLGAAQVRRAIGQGRSLYRLPWSRVAYTRRGARATIWFGGERFAGSARLARLLGGAAVLPTAKLSGLRDGDWDTLAAVVNAGHLVLEK